MPRAAFRARLRRCLAAAAVAPLLAACAAADAPERMSDRPTVRPGAEAASGAPPAPRPAAPRQAAAVPADFAAWRAGFRRRALAEGIRPEVFDAAFAGVGVNARVLELDAYQPEFVRPIWDYLDSAVSETRVETGRRLAAEKAPLLARIEARHGVDREVLLAVWGLESAYGFNYGDIPVIESLATLAHEGRRRDFAEEQLIAALRILQSGDVTPDRMVGSWAGAMGHTQFIPTSLAAYAVDFDGDGRRDLWAPDAADALASTANYLARFGWERGAPAALEVRLPAGFDHALADAAIRRDPAVWREMGVTRADGRSLPDGGEVAILAPAGAAGPAFAAYPNFRAILRYNNATSYGLAVSLLASRIAGAGPLIGDWPRGDRPLSRAETEEMQRRLTALGHDTGGTDGIVGPMTRAAIRGFQDARGLTPDGYASAELLERLRAAGG
ncbi:MAG TPA: lytic murein transglycosylase [Paracoccaceae bacterium]|nr:lytic murein transglycosylase [Paracoccaceae bacterium]